MKYQSSSTHCSKVISKVKVSARGGQNERQDKNNMPITDLRSQGHKKLILLAMHNQIGIKD